MISIEHIRLQFARLARHTECATAGYDPVTCLDLAHSLRIWVDMKADVDQTLAAMNAKPRFHNVAPDQRIKQILKGSDYVAIAGGARIRQEGKIEGFVCTGKILSENQIEQIWKMGPPLSSKTDLTFSQWLGSEIIVTKASRPGRQPRLGSRLLYFDRLLMFGHIVAKCCLANKATNTSSGFNPRWSRSWTQRSNA